MIKKPPLTFQRPQDYAIVIGDVSAKNKYIIFKKSRLYEHFSRLVDFRKSVPPLIVGSTLL